MIITAIIIAIVIFGTPHPVIYFSIAVGIDLFLSFGNGFLGLGLETKDPLYMNNIELNIHRGTASILERTINFIVALFYGFITSMVHII